MRGHFSLNTLQFFPIFKDVTIGVMSTSFLFEFWHQSHSFRGILIVIFAICFIWALIYSKFNNNLRFLIKGILLVTVAICILMIITGGVSPNNSNPLVILGIAIVCLSLMPKPPEEERDDD